MKFSEIPHRKFPLKSKAYLRLQKEIQVAAERFDDLGTSEGHMVFLKLVEVRAQLDRTWQLIREIENRHNG